ncbi:hypothetical protein LINGRAHAP2_LOCUS4468, partial [Linum grandiflorum]
KWWLLAFFLIISGKNLSLKICRLCAFSVVASVTKPQVVLLLTGILHWL